MFFSFMYLLTAFIYFLIYWMLHVDTVAELCFWKFLPFHNSFCFCNFCCDDEKGNKKVTEETTRVFF